MREKPGVPQIREPAVAGLFYPDDPLLLQQQVDNLLAQEVPVGAAPKALIVPHAGFIYSGPVAASAYLQLASVREQIQRVVLLGPAHRVAFSGLAASSARYFATPLGMVRIDQQAMDAILGLPQVRVLDEAHRDEHSLEVQLPFLQTVLNNNFGLIPLVVGDAEPDAVAEVIELLWGGPETLVLISSDLSHYHDYDTARRLDSATSHAIEQLNPQAIDYQQACGRTPVNGLLLAARHHQLQARTLDQRNSGDTAGGRDRVVGYGAYAFC
jgi:AmmeMemoRadiSam system protein B